MNKFSTGAYTHIMVYFNSTRKSWSAASLKIFEKWISLGEGRINTGKKMISPVGVNKAVTEFVWGQAKKDGLNPLPRKSFHIIAKKSFITNQIFYQTTF